MKQTTELFTFREWVNNYKSIEELADRILNDLLDLEDQVMYTSTEVSNIINYLQENLKEQE